MLGAGRVKMVDALVRCVPEVQENDIDKFKKNMLH